MRLYDCKVLLAGSRDNEVRKADVTAAEIMVLRAFHGEDAVVDVTPKAMDKRPHGAERDRLFKEYVGVSEGEGLGGFQKERAAVLMGLFGPKHTPLPVELAEKDTFADMEDEAPAPSRVKIASKSGKAEDIAAAAALA